MRVCLSIYIYIYIHIHKFIKFKGFVADTADFKRRVVPISLHGDAVAVTKRLSLDILSWSSALATGLSTKQAKMYITGVFNKCIVEGTTQDMWSIIVWCLMPLMSGIWPSRNHNGNLFHDYRDLLGENRERLCGNLVPYK